MRICFLKEPIDLLHLKIDDQQLELVTSHKVPGLVIQTNLIWNNHVESIVSKASKRLHILRVIHRGGAEINDPITIYITLMRCSCDLHLNIAASCGTTPYTPISHKS